MKVISKLWESKTKKLSAYLAKLPKYKIKVLQLETFHLKMIKFILVSIKQEDWLTFLNKKKMKKFEKKKTIFLFFSEPPYLLKTNLPCKNICFCKYHTFDSQTTLISFLPTHVLLKSHNSRLLLKVQFDFGLDSRLILSYIHIYKGIRSRISSRFNSRNSWRHSILYVLKEIAKLSINWIVTASSGSCLFNVEGFFNRIPAIATTLCFLFPILFYTIKAKC